MHELEKLKIPRCYKPEGFGEIKAVEVHHFSDTSLAGHGQCSYLRLLNKDNQAYCSFLMGKARVAPLKFITVPRLELQAAVVSIKISQWLLKELDYQDVSEFFWTDSRVVIGYINNETKRFHTFVANRIQQIHDHTGPQQWQYIESKSNPADSASRGLTACQLVDDDSRWLRGPNFLWSPGAYQTEVEENPQPLDSDDPEVKRASLVTQTNETHPVHFEISQLDRFSDWFRAKRAIAVCLRLKQRLKEGKEAGQVVRYQPVNVNEIDQAEIEIIRCLQHEHFKDEIKILSSLQESEEFHDRKTAKQRNFSLKKCSSLYRLDPFLDSNGILRVGGRLRRAIISENVKHPVILPRSLISPILFSNTAMKRPSIKVME